MVTNDKIMMSSVLQILKNLVFKSSVLIIPQIMLIFSLQENTRGAPFMLQKLTLVTKQRVNFQTQLQCEACNDVYSYNYELKYHASH